MIKYDDGSVRHVDEHPGKAELRRLLMRVARLFGLTTQAVDDLARRACIACWNEGQTLTLSGDTSGFVKFLMVGVVRIDIIIPRPAKRPAIGILKFVAPGDFFYLSPTPHHHRYHLRAAAHRRPETDGRALVAMWDRQTITQLLVGLPATGLSQLVERAWLELSRLGEDQHAMLSLLVGERIVYVLERLAIRFGVPCQDGVLIDLYLPDDVIARLVESTRSKVNREMNALCRAGVLRREGPRVVLLRTGLSTPIEASIATDVTRTSPAITATHSERARAAAEVSLVGSNDTSLLPTSCHAAPRVVASSAGRVLP